MERQGILKEHNIFIVLVILYTVGVIGHSIRLTYPYMIMLTPYTLVITGLMVLIYLFFRSTDKKLILWCLGVYITTFLLEVVGAASGLIFGDYYYGSVLGIKIFDVPIIIGFNWLFIILGTISISMRITENPYFIASSSALLAVIFDYVMEPVAMHLQYWQWYNNIVPVQNYLAWGIFVFASAYSFNKLNIHRIKGRLVEKYFIIQLVFFSLLNFILV